MVEIHAVYNSVNSPLSEKGFVLNMPIQCCWHDYVSYQSNNKPFRMVCTCCKVISVNGVFMYCTCVGLWVIILTNHEAHQLIGKDAGGNEGHPQSDVQLLSDLRLNPHKQTDVHIRTQTSTQTHTNMEKHSLVSFRSWAHFHFPFTEL